MCLHPQSSFPGTGQSLQVRSSSDQRAARVGDSAELSSKRATVTSAKSAWGRLSNY